jgi:5-methyltetrahydropteroyltriglutamate--homocysteine methyltransferase
VVPALTAAALRADHLGSLLRPAELLAAREHGAPLDELRAIEDQHIPRLLAKQAEVGCAVFTDGELRRRIFSGILADACDGFGGDVRGNQRGWSGNDQSIGVATAVLEKLQQRRPLTAHELPFMQQHSPGPIKITLPSPNQFPASAYKRGLSEGAYATREAFLADVVEIIAAEVARLADAGVPYIQIDAPRYAYYLDPKRREWLRAEIGDPDVLLDAAIRADNAVLRAGRRPGVTLGIHFCRGNNRGHWHSEGAYDPIAEKLFTGLEADRFLLEYDDERSGGFAPLRFVPRDKVAVLGLVSSKTAQLESVEAIRRRIDEASRYLPLENLALSPQCGFASIAEGNPLDEEAQWAKLRLVNELAAAVW